MFCCMVILQLLYFLEYEHNAISNMKIWKLQSNQSYNKWHAAKVITMKLRQNGCHFADDIFKCIWYNENSEILHKIPLKYIN